MTEEPQREAVRAAVVLAMVDLKRAAARYHDIAESQAEASTRTPAEKVGNAARRGPSANGVQREKVGNSRGTA
jgi:hypothetical protein